MNQPAFQRRDSGAIPDVIFIMLVLNGLVFAGQQFLGGFVDRYFALWALDSFRADFYPWQLLTYGFLHGDIIHLVFNMFMLWMFGRELEVLMGPRRFLTYYLTCLVGAGLIQLIVASL